MEVLGLVDPEAAYACQPGFITTVLALEDTQAMEWGDMAMRFLPTGEITFLIMTLELYHGYLVYKQ